MIPKPPEPLVLEDLIDTCKSDDATEPLHPKLSHNECVDHDNFAEAYSWETGYNVTWDLFEEKDGFLDLSRFLQSTEKNKKILTETLCDQSPTTNFLIRKGTLR
jgi:hypothetical protein